MTGRAGIRGKGNRQNGRRQQEQAEQKARSHHHTKHDCYPSRIAAALMRLENERNITIARVSIPKRPRRAVRKWKARCRGTWPRRALSVRAGLVRGKSLRALTRPWARGSEAGKTPARCECGGLDAKVDWQSSAPGVSSEVYHKLEARRASLAGSRSSMALWIRLSPGIGPSREEVVRYWPPSLLYADPSAVSFQPS